MRPKSDNISILKADNGLTLVHRQARYAHVDYCGVVVKAGSRDDPDHLHGLAHFVEHTIFKGTRRRSPWHIINRMERVGGELNAYTTKEETVVYTAAPRGNASRSFELIADLITESRFPDKEIDKEREVIAEEIDSYLDSPADAVFDDFEDLIFKDTALGHNILGNRQSLASIHSDDCREYLSKWYAADNMVAFYYGAIPPARIFPMLQRYFARIPAEAEAHTSLPGDFSREIFDIERNMDSHQAHSVMGCLTVDMHNDLRYAYALLSNILGGPGMNSMLNIELREKRGLVYSVETANTLLRDTGMFTVYFGCDTADTAKCCRIVRQQIERLCDHNLSDLSLNRLKKQYIGQLTVSSDAHDSLAISTGRRVLYYGDNALDNFNTDRIMAVTPSMIAECAASLSQLSRLTFT